MTVAAEKIREKTEMPEVKTVFRGVSLDGKKIQSRELPDYERVMDAEVITLDEARERFGYTWNKFSVIRNLEKNGANGVVVAQTTVLPDSYLDTLTPEKLARAYTTHLAPMV